VGTRVRPQALALLRTAGDLGMLSGAILAGLVADQTSNMQAIQVNGAVMMGIAAVAGVRFLRIVNEGKAKAAAAAPPPPGPKLGGGR
jgi:hypothetical protein